jgi:ActR/RegA family two-component response regulator
MKMFRVAIIDDEITVCRRLKAVLEKDGDGMEILAGLKNLQKDVEIIMITCYGSIDFALEAISKPSKGELTIN